MTQKEIARLKREKKKTEKKTQVNIYNEIDGYLFQNKEISSDALSNKTQLRTAVTYLFESFMTMPKVCIHLDKHLNGKTENLLTHDILEILDFYKLIVQTHKIKKFQLYKCFPNRAYGNNINTIKNKLGIGTSEAKAFFINRDILNPDELEAVLGNKAFKADDNLQEEVLKAIERDKLQGTNTQIQIKPELGSVSNPEPVTQENDSKNRFLSTIDQKIISDLSLSLFDIRILKNENKFLYIFIDKYHRKRYYKDNFKAEFFISKITGVINNSYIEPNSENFIKYLVTHHQDLSSIRYAVDQEYKKTILL
jgi:hypothetical protein